jgi:DNA-binding XRE family transcriptional regulator
MPKRGGTATAERPTRTQAEVAAALLADTPMVAAQRPHLRQPAAQAPKPTPKGSKRVLQREQHDGAYIHESHRTDGKVLRRVMTQRPFLFGLKAVREARALTQVQLAKAASVDPLTISRLENQKNPANAPTQNRLARVLQVDPRVLEKQEADITEADIPKQVPPDEPPSGY